MSEIRTRPLGEAKAKLLSRYKGRNPQDYILTNPGNYFMPKTYERYAERLSKFEIRDDDVFVLTWPKNGTTWTQELVWSLLNYDNIDNAKTISLHQRVPYFEGNIIMEFLGLETDEDILETKFQCMKSPRIFKSHLPFSLLPPKVLDRCKVVACLRNPKDTLVSYYKYMIRHPTDLLSGDLDTYFDLFMEDLIVYAPFWDLVLDRWNKREHPNMCLLFFEDMKRDFAGNIRKVAEFLQKDISDSVVDDLVDRLSFKKLKEESEVKKEGSVDFPHVYRKGEVGDWKNHFTEEMNERMDKVIAEKLKDSGLQFTYE